MIDRNTTIRLRESIGMIRGTNERIVGSIPEM